MKWSESYTVRYHDTDANEIVGPSHIFKFLQETVESPISPGVVCSRRSPAQWISFAVISAEESSTA